MESYGDRYRIAPMAMGRLSALRRSSSLRPQPSVKSFGTLSDPDRYGREERFTRSTVADAWKSSTERGFSRSSHFLLLRTGLPGLQGKLRRLRKRFQSALDVQRIGPSL